MANFQRAIEWLKSGGKVRRPSWEEDSYWILGVDESIQWANQTHAHIHINQIEATDWEIYEEKKDNSFMVCCVCGRIDESHSAYCSSCNRVPHRLMTKEQHKKFKELLKDLGETK